MIGPRTRSLGIVPALVAVVLLSALALGSGGAAAAVKPPPCPSFRILHDDRIGAANLPAGSYRIAVAATSGLSCAETSRLFARFLEDYDGVLPRPWRVIAEGTGKASFAQGAGASFSVALTSGGGGEGSNRSLGVLCRNTFTVNSNVLVSPLTFAKGQYLLYLPTGSGISCNRAAVLFTRFLGSPRGILPFPWRLQNQTATFFKPEHPVRSSFRVEPLTGSNPAVR